MSHLIFIWSSSERKIGSSWHVLSDLQLIFLFHTVTKMKIAYLITLVIKEHTWSRWSEEKRERRITKMKTAHLITLVTKEHTWSHWSEEKIRRRITWCYVLDVITTVIDFRYNKLRLQLPFPRLIDHFVLPILQSRNGCSRIVAVAQRLLVLATGSIVVITNDTSVQLTLVWSYLTEDWVSISQKTGVRASTVKIGPTFADCLPILHTQ